MANGKPILKEKDKRQRLPSLSKLQHKCDKRMQEIGKIIHPKCLLCGKPTDCQHHFFPKSVSSALRYNWSNLIPVCRGCHCRIHQSGDPSYEQEIIQIMGEDWYESLKRHKRDSIKVNRTYYEKVAELLENHLARCTY